jgi:hypothetical protein
LRIAGHHDRLRRIDGLSRPQIVAEARYIGGGFLALAEQARIDCNKAMPDIRGVRLFGVRRIGDRVHLWTAQQGDAVWLDLADAEGRAVSTAKDGWHVVPCKEVMPKFFRPPNMRPLPEPLQGKADMSQLHQLLNLRDEKVFRLLLTWLSFAIVPDKPYLIIAASGPARAAKSSFAELARAAIDPSEVPLVGSRTNPDDLARDH